MAILLDSGVPSLNVFKLNNWAFCYLIGHPTDFVRLVNKGVFFGVGERVCRIASAILHFC